MSISSAASNLSVSLGGREMSLEQALDEATKEIQEGLNTLQIQLRALAMAEEQFIEDDDWMESVALEDIVGDVCDGLKELLDELKDITRTIVDKPPNKELRAWWADHKRARKEAAKANKDAARLAKEEARLAAVEEEKS